MGNEHSTQKKRQKANTEKKVQNGELNGHAVPAPDVAEPEMMKKAAVEQKSETPPAPVTDQPKPPEKEEVDSSKPNGSAHVETTPEPKTAVATVPEPSNKAPKPSGDEVSGFFGKMFKKKSETVKHAAEIEDVVDALAKALDLNDVQPDKGFINANQKEILEEVAEKIKLQLVDAIPAQPISSGLLTKRSSNADEIIQDLPATQEPVAFVKEPTAEEPVKRKVSEMHIGLVKSEGAPDDAKVAEDEEPKAEDAEKALREDKELIQLVESIISEEKEQACENQLNDELTKLADEADNVSSVVKLAVDTFKVEVEEPVVGAEEPLLVAEEIADIVEEIFQITQEQESLDAEESEKLQRKKFKETLVVTEEPLSTFVEPALIAEEEIAPAPFMFILAANGPVALDEESWVVIEEPARPLNISGCLEEPVLARSKCNSADSTQLLSQLRSACTKVLKDASYEALSVDVCAVKSTVHIRIELCPDEFTFPNKVSCNTDDHWMRKLQHGQTHRM